MTAMIGGRVVWGIVTMICLSVGGGAFTWTAFLSGALLSAIPGIILQLVLVPVVVIVLQKANLIPKE